MRKTVKTLILLEIILSFSPLFISSKVFANESKNMIYKSGISIKKRWKITFSQPINQESIRDNLKIIDKNSKKEISYSIYLDRYNFTVEIIPSNSSYNPDSEYLLIIDKNLTSKYNKKLNSPTILDFKTDSIILNIENINATIKQEEEYKLPNTVSAKMSNGTFKDYKVMWDKNLTLTSIPGNYRYYGTVENYSKKVMLNLTITPFKTVSNISGSKRNQSSFQVQLYNYLMVYDNREAIMKRAIELHDGDINNNCVYFASEALRRSGLDLPLGVSNTITLTSKLRGYGWKTNTDLSYLLPGDICFTTEKDFGPTHTYIFMGWVNENNFEYGYVCDNQGNEYGNNAYHKRNINFATAEKESISYFMYVP